MNKNPVRQLPVPSSLGDILRLVSGARRPVSTGNEEQQERTDFIGSVCVFSERFERWVGLAELEAIASASETPRDAAAHHPIGFWGDLCAPCDLGWIPSGNAFSTVSPAILGSGRYHESYSSPDKGGFLTCAVGWEYLVTQLAARRALTPGSLDNFQLGETQALLVLAAKAQRSILSRMLISSHAIAGDLTALAVKANPPNLDFDSYLVTVSELTDVDRNGPQLVSRAKRELSKSNELSDHHCILLTDDISRTSMRDDTNYSCDQQIHLIGNPDDVRFIVFVSAVAKQGVSTDMSELYEGRFRLDRSRLRKVFMSRAREGSNFVTQWSKSLTVELGSALENLSFPNLLSGEVALPHVSGKEDSEESIISREQIARKFFGYRSPDID